MSLVQQLIKIIKGGGILPHIVLIFFSVYRICIKKNRNISFANVFVWQIHRRFACKDKLVFHNVTPFRKIYAKVYYSIALKSIYRNKIHSTEKYIFSTHSRNFGFKPFWANFIFPAVLIFINPLCILCNRKMSNFFLKTP